MPGIGQPGGGGSEFNPDGTRRITPHPDDPAQIVLPPAPLFAHRNINVTKCSPQQGLRNIVNSINEIYHNIEAIYNNSNAFNLNVSNNEGTVYVQNVKDLIASCMSVEDLEGNTARITPKTAQLFQAPPAGIAAATTTTLPSGTCTVLELQSGVLKTTTQTATVYNAGATAITGDYVFMAHPVVPGCVYITMSCCENALTLGTGGDGGTTDPPEPPGGSGGGGQRFGCTSADNLSLHYQYDISLYGIWDTGGFGRGGAGDATCFNCIAADSEPYTIRATWWQTIPDNELSPCGVAGCTWAGNDINTATIPDDADFWLKKWHDPNCENVTVTLALRTYDRNAVPNVDFLNCIRTGVFSEEEVEDIRGHYLSCTVLFGGGTWGWCQFIKKVSNDPSTPFNMDLSNFEMDLYNYRFVASLDDLAGHRKTPCQPRSLTPNVDEQGRTYISISKVETGGLLSI